LGGLIIIPAQAGDDGPKIIAATDTDLNDGPGPAPKGENFLFRTVATDDFRPGGKELPWLGVGVQETTEPLAAQLGLKPGEGLVVNFVATNSPASEAGLQKNDVLTEFDGQMLVDLIQLRKLVQMHADGDRVKIEYYRTGKKESATAKLALHTYREAALDGELSPFGERKRLFYAPTPRALALPEPDKGSWTIQVQQASDQARRAMVDAQRAVEQAMRESLDGTDGVNRKLEIIQKKLGKIAEGGMDLKKDATVIVRNDGESVRTMVKKDDSGTYVIVADPAKHLTAHDTDGKLLFDGPIESLDQQKNVPKEVWTKVQPMLEQLNRRSADGKASREINAEEE
jgi:hypothetical protein